MMDLRLSKMTVQCHMASVSQMLLTWFANDWSGKMIWLAATVLNNAEIKHTHDFRKFSRESETD